MATHVQSGGGRRSQAKERFWWQHVRRQAAGSLSVREYCNQHGLGEPSFYAWRKKLLRRDGSIETTARRASTRMLEESTAEFLRVDLRPDASRVDSTIEIVLPGELRVRVPVSATRGQVREVLAALGVVTVGEEQPC